MEQSLQYLGLRARQREALLRILLKWVVLVLLRHVTLLYLFGLVVDVLAQFGTLSQQLFELVTDCVNSLEQVWLLRRDADELVLQHLNLLNVLLVVYLLLVPLNEDVDFEPFLEEEQVFILDVQVFQLCMLVAFFIELIVYLLFHVLK